MTKIRDRDQIIDAAARLFSAKGYEATSLDDIAVDLGTARSALYYHVSGKAELRALIQVKRARMLADEAEAIALGAGSPAEKVAAFVRAHLHHFERFFPESRMWTEITTVSTVQDEVAGAVHAQQKRIDANLREVIRQGIASGDFRDTDVSVAALGVLGMCHYVTTWYRPGGRLTIADIAEVFAPMAVGALRVRGESPSHESE